LRWLVAAVLAKAGRLVARALDEDELTGNWTLAGDELEQLSGRRGATKLGFAVLLWFYTVHGRFPAGRGEIPDRAVAHVARLVDVPAAELGFYVWDGRTIKAYRADIRRYFGFRGCSVADADKAAEWLSANVCEKSGRQARSARSAPRTVREPGCTSWLSATMSSTWRWKAEVSRVVSAAGWCWRHGPSRRSLSASPGPRRRAQNSPAVSSAARV